MSLVERALAIRTEEIMKGHPKEPRKRRRAVQGQVFPKPSRVERRKAQAAEREQTILKRAELRSDVLVRALFRCENPDCRVDLKVAGAEMDHWLGGNGRREHKESMESLWVLCPQCHRNRHHNVPSAVVWNERHEEHCEKHGYPFVPHRTKYDGLATIAEEL